MNEEILKVMKDIQATPQLSKEVVNDDFFVQYIDDLSEKIENLSKLISVEDFFQIVYVFTNEGMYFGLDETYLNFIEQMPNYPPVELFISTAPNTIIADLRERSFARGEIAFHPSISNFAEVFDKYKNTEISIDNLVNESLVRKCSVHEMRLLVELVMFIMHGGEYNHIDLRLALHSIALYLDRTPESI